MTTSQHALRCVLWTTLGALSLWGFREGPWWMREALTALFFGRAALPLIQLIGALRQKSPDLSLARGYSLMAVGSAVAGVLVGVGAAWQRSFVSFVVAYGAFSYAWVWSWIGWRVSRSQDNLAAAGRAR